MASTGTFRKGRERREEILTAAMEVFAQEGYRGTSLRDIAQRVGLSLTGLMHYFDSKEELLTATLQRRDAEYQELFDRTGGFIDGLIAVMRHNAEVPGQVELNATLAAAAGDKTHPAHDYFRNKTETILQFITSQIESMQSSGQIASSVDASRLATLVLAISDGVQIQWISNPELPMADLLGYFWTLIQSISDDRAELREARVDSARR